MKNFCHSCGMPLEETTKSSYCQYCSNEKGELKSREEVTQGIAGWLMQITPEQKNVDYLKRAKSYINAMPAWAE